MATDNDVIINLQKSSEALLKRPLTQAEKQELIQAFNSGAGTNYEKALGAVGKVTGLTQGQIMLKSAASDDADRAVKDLEKVMKEWNK